MGPSISPQKFTGENADADRLSHPHPPSSDQEHGTEYVVQQTPARSVEAPPLIQNDNVGEPTGHDQNAGDERLVERIRARKDTWGSIVVTDVLFDASDPLFKTTASEAFNIATGSEATNHTEHYPSESAAESTSSYRPDGIPQTQRSKIAIQEEKAVKSVYEIIAEWRPEVADIIEQDLGTLWDFVQNCPHPLAHYRPSASLTPDGTLDNNETDPGLIGMSRRENAFNYCLARRLGLLRPRSPELMATLVPCELFWDLDYNKALKKSLRTHVFETIHGRWNAIYLAREVVSTWSKMWEGEMPAVWLKVLDSHFSTSARTSDLFGNYRIVQEIIKLLETDPLSIQDRSPGISTKLVLYDFAHRLESNHNLIFTIPQSLEMSEGQRMWATLKFYAFFTIACAQPYGSIFLPQRCDYSIWTCIKSTTFQERSFKDREITVKGFMMTPVSFDTTKRKDKYKARAEIRENRKNFKAFSFRHRPKDATGSPSVAVDDPNLWFLALPWNKPLPKNQQDDQILDTHAIHNSLIPSTNTSAQIVESEQLSHWRWLRALIRDT